MLTWIMFEDSVRIAKYTRCFWVSKNGVLWEWKGFSSSERVFLGLIRMPSWHPVSAQHSSASRTAFTLHYKDFVKTQPAQRDQNSVVMRTSKHKIQSTCSTPFWYCVAQKSTANTLLSSLPNALPSLHATFTRRTSGQWLATLRAVKCAP